MIDILKITILKLLFISVIITPNSLHTKSNDSPDFENIYKPNISWNDWINQIKKDLKQSSIKEGTLDYLNFIKFNPRVIELDRKQPEFKLTFNEYLGRIINKESKKKINIEYSKNLDLFNKLEREFDLNSKILASLWGIETFFGRHLGKLDILRSLASLAYDGRRRDFFLKELKNALIILDQGHFRRDTFTGSWAGAFGQTQFMPSTFLKYAIDFDGDKKKNVFEKKDALASGANYLKKIGWNKNLNWGEKINIKIDDELRILSEDKEFKNIQYWKSKGINLVKNYNDHSLRLIIPDSNNNNECYLVSKNFDVILDWNRSNYFALTVFLFSDEIK